MCHGRLVGKTGSQTDIGMPSHEQMFACLSHSVPYNLSEQPHSPNSESPKPPWVNHVLISIKPQGNTQGILTKEIHAVITISIVGHNVLHCIIQRG